MYMIINELLTINKTKNMKAIINNKALQKQIESFLEEIKKETGATDLKADVTPGRFEDSVQISTFAKKSHYFLEVMVGFDKVTPIGGILEI